MTPIAALAAAVAVLLWRPPGRWLVRQRLGCTRSSSNSRAPLALGLVSLSLIAPLTFAVSAPRLILALTACLVATFVTRVVRDGRSRRRAGARSTAVAESIGLMAAELRAGNLPQRVLAGLAPDFEFLAPAARAADLGGDVPAALLDASNEPGAELLAELSGAWYVADRAGAPLARILDRLEQTAREDLEIEREVQSGLAPARATGRLMAVLPLFGLALGSGMGGDPVAILTSTLPGALCLAAGSALACAGVAWVERIATTGEQ